MPLETCQMLSIVCSDEWGHNYGKIHRNDGNHTKHPKVDFAIILAQSGQMIFKNAWWLLTHGIALSLEYTLIAMAKHILVIDHL